MRNFKKIELRDLQDRRAILAHRSEDTIDIYYPADFEEAVRAYEDARFETQYDDIYLSCNGPDARALIEGRLSQYRRNDQPFYLYECRIPSKETARASRFDRAVRAIIKEYGIPIEHAYRVVAVLTALTPRLQRFNTDLANGALNSRDISYMENSTVLPTIAYAKALGVTVYCEREPRGFPWRIRTPKTKISNNFGGVDWHVLPASFSPFLGVDNTNPVRHDIARLYKHFHTSE